MDTDALTEHLFDSMLGAFDVLTVAIGDRLGFYDALRSGGPATSADLAARTGTHERHVREWLEQQAVAGLLEVDDPGKQPGERCFSLPEAHVPVLADRDGVGYLASFMDLTAAAAAQLPAVVGAFRSGGGVPWAAYGADMRRAQGAANRPLFLSVLGQEWLPAIPEVHERLVRGGRVADVGNGEGWSSVGIALAYPAVSVDGFDVDPASVEAAHQHAVEHGVADRVRAHLVDGAEAPHAAYDVVLAFECLHDMPDPVSVLARMRELAGDDGVVVVMDERTPEAFTGPGDPMEQLFYGYSVTVCLPDGLSHPGSVGTGTVMRPSTLDGYAREAGFAGATVLPVEHEAFRFYRLDRGMSAV